MELGTKVARWEVIGERFKAGTKWFYPCVCECGTVKNIREDNLKGPDPRSKSCGCLNKEKTSGVRNNLEIGSKYGMLTVTGDTVIIKDEAMTPVRCECGNEKQVRRNHLTSSRVVSCGCYNLSLLIGGSRNHKHGMAGSAIYHSWSAMKARCYNPNESSYKNYGGRGITVCDRWLESFENFYEDMGERPDGMTLERVNVDGNYCKENCVWASKTQQCFNRRKFKDKSSQYVGVNWDNWKEKWTATLKKNRETVFKKDFLTEEAAARAYDDACFEHYGVRKNFPDT